MRVVVQRVREAEVTVDGTSVGRIGRGLVRARGLAVGDGEDDIAWMARKIAGLRVFDDGTTLQRSVVEIGGAVLAVSQFTLLADCRKGRRPVVRPRHAGGGGRRALRRASCAQLRAVVGDVATGSFGATMQVRLVNDGPFTLVIDSSRAAA